MEVNVEVRVDLLKKLKYYFSNEVVKGRLNQSGKGMFLVVNICYDDCDSIVVNKIQAQDQSLYALSNLVHKSKLPRFREPQIHGIIIRIEQDSKVFIIVLQKVHQKLEYSIKNSSDLILLGQISQLGNGSTPAQQRLGNSSAEPRSARQLDQLNFSWRHFVEHLVCNLP
ncbi:hypothetical protein LXL04_007166 [Taraxacum kok-saghyz]